MLCTSTTPAAQDARSHCCDSSFVRRAPSVWATPIPPSLGDANITHSSRRIFIVHLPARPPAPNIIQLCNAKKTGLPVCDLPLLHPVPLLHPHGDVRLHGYLGDEHPRCCARQHGACHGGQVPHGEIGERSRICSSLNRFFACVEARWFRFLTAFSSGCTAVGQCCTVSGSYCTDVFLYRIHQMSASTVRG